MFLESFWELCIMETAPDFHSFFYFLSDCHEAYTTLENNK